LIERVIAVPEWSIWDFIVKASQRQSIMFNQRDVFTVTPLPMRESFTTFAIMKGIPDEQYQSNPERQEAIRTNIAVHPMPKGTWVPSTTGMAIAGRASGDHGHYRGTQATQNPGYESMNIAASIERNRTEMDDTETMEEALERERAYSRLLEFAFDARVAEEAERRMNERVQADIDRRVEELVFEREHEAYILTEAGSKTDNLLDAILPRKSKKTLRSATKKDVELACVECLKARNPKWLLAFWFYLISQEMPEDKTVWETMGHSGLKFIWQDAERKVESGHRLRLSSD
jgi:hypothetical protein